MIRTAPSPVGTALTDQHRTVLAVLERSAVQVAAGAHSRAVEAHRDGQADSAAAHSAAYAMGMRDALAYARREADHVGTVVELHILVDRYAVRDSERPTQYQQGMAAGARMLLAAL